MKRTVAFLLVLALGAQACGLEKGKITQPKETSDLSQARVISPLSAHPELEARVKMAPGVVSTAPSLGSLNFDEAFVVELNDVETRIVAIPFDQGNRGLITYVQENEAALKSIVIDFASTDNQSAFTGEITVLEPSTGRVVAGATYKNDQFVAEKPGVAIEDGDLQAINWAIFAACARYRWSLLPWGIRWACGQFAGACFTGNFVMCSYALGCAGAVLGPCVVQAWR